MKMVILSQLAAKESWISPQLGRLCAVPCTMAFCCAYEGMGEGKKEKTGHLWSCMRKAAALS